MGILSNFIPLVSRFVPPILRQSIQEKTPKTQTSIYEKPVDQSFVGQSYFETPTLTESTPPTPEPPKGILAKIDNLKDIIPNKVITQIPGVVNDFSINTELRLAHFLAQCAHESNNFKFSVENLNYSADGLQRVFKKYFPTPESTNGYARNPEKIANKVYANRMGNGNENSGDGYLYRGRGYIQLTGKNNYSSFSKDTAIDCVNSPDLVALLYPLLSAAWFFHKNNINKISDKGAGKDTITAVSKAVNGGTIGLEDRIHWFNLIYDKLK